MLLPKFVFSFISYTSFQISALTVKTHGGDVANVSGLTTKCIKDLGCFPRLYPYYHPIHRPISCLPQDGIYPKFMLYTRRNTKHHVYLEGNQDSVRNSTFDPLVKTIVIVHGYFRKFSDMPFLITMKDMLLKHDAFNVIIVNWADFNGFPYTQAVPNARVVGAWLAKLLQFLHEYTRIRLESVHLIGHSLGAHISGWAGERLKNLGRITGLDPAGPFFYHAPNLVKLDATDAKFVDIICTNVGTSMFNGYGLSEPTGHLNFYPNGGILQPGCVPEEDISKSVHRFDSCSHERVVYFFIESIDNGSCVFEGVPCDNWKRYESGKCGDSLNKPKLTIKMGFHATKPKDDTNSERIFLKTRGSYPYCIED